MPDPCIIHLNSECAKVSSCDDTEEESDDD